MQTNSSLTRKWLIRLLFWLCIPFCAIALLIACLLTLRVWNATIEEAGLVAVHRGQHVASALAAPASGVAAESKGVQAAVVESFAGSDRDKDAISNTMTALGMVLAAITLLLTLGTAWHAKLLNEVEEAKRVLDASEQQSERNHIRSAALMSAKRELSTWLCHQPGVAYGDMLAQWSLALETLGADDRDLRFQAYHDLMSALRFHAVELPEIGRYCTLCHQHALTRLELEASRKRLSRHEVQLRIDQGLWCLLFDPVEHAQLMRELASK